MSTSVQLVPINYVPESTHWFQQLRHFNNPVWLDSGRPRSLYGRFDILSAAPSTYLRSIGKTTYIENVGGFSSTHENPFTLLKHYLATQQTSLTEIPFCGGALGYFGYDLGRRLEQLPEKAAQDIDLPDMSIGIYPWAIVQDHQEQLAWLVINHALAPDYNFSEIKAICSSAEKSRFCTEQVLSRDYINPFKINAFSNNINVSQYHNAIAKIQSYITAGDCYQVNFAQRFSTNFEGDTFSAYLSLRTSLPSPFSAYMETTDGVVLSLSPERFIKLTENFAETQPIKGTIKRGKTPAEDADNAQILQNSLKDRAENLMIVDLLRNDLSKTCQQVKVPELFKLQSFANVHHLVSTVTGELKPGIHALDLLASSFPGGSITGAPKIRAMEIIEELEPCRRSVYCGSVGYISACGNMDTNIAIRTLVANKNKLYCWGGGGIVADSNTNLEYQESMAKVQLLMDTLQKNFGH